MLKPALLTGIVLLVAGVSGCWWSDDNALQNSRRLVLKRTYERRGPVVTLHEGADRVRTADGRALAMTMLLGADGYWVRSRPQYLTRDGLTGTKILVLDEPWDEVGDGRTTTFLTRWINEGGSVLLLTRGRGPDDRTEIGAGRVAVLDPSAFNTTEFVERLLAAAHWLDRNEHPIQGDGR
jgi:hypothetical protein